MVVVYVGEEPLKLDFPKLNRVMIEKRLVC